MSFLRCAVLLGKLKNIVLPPVLPSMCQYPPPIGICRQLRSQLTSSFIRMGDITGLFVKRQNVIQTLQAYHGRACKSNVFTLNILKKICQKDTSIKCWHQNVFARCFLRGGARKRPVRSTSLQILQRIKFLSFRFCVLNCRIEPSTRMEN